MSQNELERTAENVEAIETIDVVAEDIVAGLYREMGNDPHYLVMIGDAPHVMGDLVALRDVAYVSDVIVVRVEEFATEEGVVGHITDSILTGVMDDQEIDTVVLDAEVRLV